MPIRKHKPSSAINRYIFSLTLLFTVFAFPWNATATETTPPIRIAIMPCTDIVKTFTQFQPLRTYLQQQTHRQIEIVVPNTFQEFKRTILKGEAEFTFQPPHAYLLMANQYDPQNILSALTPNGESMHRGVIVAAKDSGIKKVSDLRGKKVLFGHLFSTAKWLAAKSLLEANGLDLKKDLKDYAHGGSCESIAMNVYLGQVDAGAMCDYSFDEITENSSPREDELPPEALVVIGSTWEIPTWVFAAHQDTDKEISRQVTNALLKLDRRNPEHREIMEEMELGGFIRNKDSNYDSLRKHLTTAGLPSR